MADLAQQVSDGVARLNVLNSAMTEILKNAQALEDQARAERLKYNALKQEREGLTQSLGNLNVLSDIQKAQQAAQEDRAAAAEQRTAAEKLMAELTAAKADLDAATAAAKQAAEAAKKTEPGTGEPASA